MEIMEAREQLDECSSQEECDAIRVSNKGKPCIPMLRTVYPNHLSHFYPLSVSLSPSLSLSFDLSIIIEQSDQVVQELAETFKTQPVDFERAKTLTTKLQYLQTLDNAAKEWQPGKRVEITH